MTPAIEIPDLGALRTRRIGYSAATSLLSKLSTALLLLWSMPYAYRVLGAETFAGFATLSAGMAWLSALNLGLGTAIVRPIARAVAAGDVLAQAGILGSAALPVIAASLLLGIAGAVLLLTAPFELLFGSQLHIPERAMRLAACAMLTAAVMSSIAMLCDGLRLAYQEQHIHNLYGAAGNIATAALLFLVAQLQPSLAVVVWIIVLPPVLARLASGWTLLSTRQYLYSSLRRFDLKQTRSLLIDGGAFLLAGLSNFPLYQWPTVLIARRFPAAQIAGAAAALNLFLVQFGVLSTISATLWPAVADAVARGDIDWARTASRNAILTSLTYAAGSGLVIAVVGPWILFVAFGRRFQAPRELLVALGVYCALAAWEYIHFSLLMGLGEMRAAALLIVVRAVAFAVALPFALARWSVTGVGIALCLSVIPTTLFWLPRQLRRALRRESAHLAAGAR